MREACRSAGLTDPEFREVGNYFQVIFYKRQTVLALELKLVFELLRDKGSLASSQIAQYLDIHQNTALKRLNKLIEMKMVTKEGRGRDVKYKLLM